MDLEKLTSAPWEWHAEDGSLLTLSQAGDDVAGHVLSCAPCGACQKRGAPCLGPSKADAEFIALARNAFDVMMRRGWCPVLRDKGEWVVQDGEEWVYRFANYGGDGSRINAADPFTALVEADRWYRANVEQPK